MPTGQSVGDIYLDLRLNQSIFDRQMGALQKVTSKLMSKIAATAGFVYLGKKVYDLAAAWMELGSDLEEVQNVVDVTFKTMSERVNEFSKTTQELVGINETTTKRFMGQFGAMSKAFGFSEEQAYNMSEALVKLGGDTASFYNLTSDLAFTKIKSVFTGETETLKDLGIVMTQSALDQHALSKGINKTVSEMSEQEKVALRLNFVMEQLSLAQGDYNRTFDGYANTMKNIAQTFEAAKTKIGQALINLTAGFRTMLLQIAQLFDKIGEKFLEFSRKFTKGKDVKNPASAVSDITSEVTNLGTETEETQKKVERFVAGFDKLNKVSSSSDSSSKSTLSDPNLINKLLAEALNYNSGEIKEKTKETSGLLDKIAKKYPKLAKSTRGLVDSIKELASISFDYLKIFWNKFLKPLGEYALDNIIPAFLDVIKGIIEVICSILKANKPLFEFILDKILTPLGKIVGKVLTAALELLAKALEKLARWIEKNPEKVQALTVALITLWGTIKLVMAAVNAFYMIKAIISIVSALGGVSAVASGAVGTLGAAIASVGVPVIAVIAIITTLVTAVVMMILHWDKVKEAGVNAFNKIKETIGIMIDTILEIPTILGGIGEMLLTTFTAPFAGIKANFTSLIEEIKELGADGTLSITDMITAVFKSTINGVITYIETIINASIKGINGILRAVTNASGSDVGTIQAVNLPKFASGGYVPGSGSNKGIIARVGDVPEGQGEWILRTNQMRSLLEENTINTMRSLKMANSNSENQTDVYVYLDSEQISSRVIKKNKQAKLTTGHSII